MKKLMLTILVLSTLQPALADNTVAGQSGNRMIESPFSQLSDNNGLGRQQVVTAENQMLSQGTEIGSYTDTDAGVKKFWGDDIVSHMAQECSQYISRLVESTKNFKLANFESSERH